MVLITTELLDALLSPDSKRRGDAETFFQSLPLMDRLTGLTQLIIISATNNDHVPHHLVSLAAVLLRRDILRMSDYQAVIQIVDPLLGPFLMASTPHATRIAIGHCLAETCGSVALLSPFPKDKEQVVERILVAISNPVGQGDIPSLRLLAAIADRSPFIFASTVVPSLGSLTHQVLSSQFNNDANRDTLLEALIQVLVQAAIATQISQTSNMPILPFNTALVDTIDPSSTATTLSRGCLLPIMEHVACLPSSSTLAILQQLTYAASQCPSFLAGDKSVLVAVLDTCLAIANASQNDSTTAIASLDVIASLCAVGDVKRKILAADPVLGQRILQGSGGVIIWTAHWMTVGLDDDTEGWAIEPPTLLEEDPWDGDDTAQYAETLMQSYLHSLPAVALSVVLPLVDQQLQHSKDWRRLSAGLSMMEACLAFAPVSFSSHVPAAINAALSLATAAQPFRVQFQALRLLGVLCESENAATADLIRQTYRVPLLVCMAHALHSPCTKLSALACIAVVSFVRMQGGDGSNKANPLDHCLADIVQSLVKGPLSHAAIDRGLSVVKIRAIGAIACIAENSGEAAFVPFYSFVMPSLLACAQIPPVSPEAWRLIGAAVEGVTVVGQAIASDETTKTHYMQSAVQLMQFIVPILQQRDGASSDIPIDQLLASCARIAVVMGSAYTSFIPVVLPVLLERATAQPEMSVTEGDEADLNATKRQLFELDEDTGVESMTVAVPGKGVQKFTVNTTQMQTKAQAARAIYEHADALGATFDPFVHPCLEALLPLVSFAYSPEVRSTSALAMAKVFEAACSSADETNDGSRLNHYFSTLIKAVAKQIELEGLDDRDALFALADALSELFYCVYQRKDGYGHRVASTLSYGDAEEVVRIAIEAVSACLKRRADIYRRLSGQEGDLAGEDEREECNSLLRQEEQLLTPLVDSIGYTLKFLREGFVPIFEKHVAPVIQPCLTNGDVRAKLCAVCLYDDCIEHCGPEAAGKQSEKLVYGILLGIDDQTNGNDKELHSASIYGVAQICRYGTSSVLAPHLDSIFHHLLKVVNSCGKEETESPMMYENAVSALASMTLIGSAPFANSAHVDHAELLNLFVENLPLREDPVEAKICHQGFADLCEKGTIDVTANAAVVLRVMGETLNFASEGEDIATEEVISRMVNIAVTMQKKVPQSTLSQTFASLSSEAQNGIKMALQ